MKGVFQYILRLIEFILLFFGVPIYIYFDPEFIHPSAIVLPVMLVIFIYLYRLPEFKFRELVQLKINKKILLKHLIIFAIISSVLILIIFIFDKENLFNLPKANPQIWIMLCIFYPLFSAYGQEIIYRTFIFYRYCKIFKSKLAFVVASSIAFSFVHIVYYSHISIILTFILGLYLTYTYLKTKSVLFSSILHGIYGDLVFTIGLGSYFWLDMHQWM